MSIKEKNTSSERNIIFIKNEKNDILSWM